MGTSRPQSFLTALLVASAVATLAPPANAQAEDQAAARALFVEGRRLTAAGSYDLACPKFEAARRLYASAGVLLNLADCYEKTGRTASAWTTFGEALSAALRTNRAEEAAEAKRRQTSLEPRLTRLTLHVVHQEPGLSIKRDGLDVPAAVWGVAIPVDPGTHEIRADAAGFESWTKSLSATSAAQTTTVEVPELHRSPVTPSVVADGPPPPGAATNSSGSASALTNAPSNDEDHPGKTQRTIGLFVGGAGVVTMGVGGVLALLAKVQDDAAAAEHGDMRVSDAADAVHLANSATVVVLTGAAAAAAGLVIWLTAPRTAATIGFNGRELGLRVKF